MNTKRHALQGHNALTYLSGLTCVLTSNRNHYFDETKKNPDVENVFGQRQCRQLDTTALVNSCEVVVNILCQYIILKAKHSI